MYPTDKKNEESAVERIAHALAGPKLTVDQVGILVGDLDQGMERFAALYGIDEWRIWTYDAGFVPFMTYGGRSARYEMQVALSDSDPQIELIEPLSGPSIYDDWIAAHGYGMHHIGTFTKDVVLATRAMQDAGVDVMQSGGGYGIDGDGGYAYFDTQGILGLIVELIEVPAQRRPPHRVWRTERERPDT